MLVGQRKKSQKYFDLSTFNYNLYDSNPCSSLGVMNFQKWELFSGSPGIIYIYIYIPQEYSLSLDGQSYCFSWKALFISIDFNQKVLVLPNIWGDNTPSFPGVHHLFVLLLLGMLDNQHRKRERTAVSNTSSSCWERLPVWVLGQILTTLKAGVWLKSKAQLLKTSWTVREQRLRF